MNNLKRIALVLLLLFLTAPLVADEGTMIPIALGTSLSDTVFHDRETSMVSFDLTLSHAFFKGGRFNYNIDDFQFILWFSGGLKQAFTDRNLFFPYVEAGIWYFITIGGGVSFGGGEYRGTFANCFIGVPVPLAPIFGSNTIPLFVEPYFRYNWSLENAGRNYYELGIMVKYVFLFRTGGDDFDDDFDM